jgi:type II secretory pathway pseudopilin PulG
MGYPHERERGFTYIGVLILVAIAGVALAGTGELWSTAAKREKEAQLLFVGDEFRRAIGSYYESSPGLKQFPERLEDLLEDKRVPVVRRHLRKLYADPIMNTWKWGLVKQGDRIVGVHSLSEDKPLKRANFGTEDEVFNGIDTYSGWRFVYEPKAAPRAPPTPNQPSASTPGQPSPPPVPTR